MLVKVHDCGVNNPKGTPYKKIIGSQLKDMKIRKYFDLINWLKLTFKTFLSTLSTKGFGFVYSMRKNNQPFTLVDI